MFKKNQIIISVVLVLSVTNAQAFGFGDLLGAGISAAGSVVGAVGGAAVDKIKDSMTDPAAEAKKKQAEQEKVSSAFQSKIDQINGMSNLRPIDRQRLILTLQKQQTEYAKFQGIQDQADEARKVQRAQVFTASGLMNVAGNAVTSMPSLQIAQASAMANNPVYRQTVKAQNAVVFNQANLEVAAKIPQTESRITLAETDAVNKTGLTQAGTKLDMKLVDASAKLNVTPEKIAGAATVVDEAAKQVSEGVSGASAAHGNTTTAQMDADAFKQDIDRKIYVSFVESPKQTEHIKDLLKSRGYKIVDSKNQADVTYLLEGEYYVFETGVHKGITQEIGTYLDNPNTAIAPPDTKMAGRLASGLTSFALSLPGTHPVPGATEGIYKQKVLLVVARQLKSGAEARCYVVKEAENSRMDGIKLAKEATEEIYDMLGINDANSVSKTQPSSVTGTGRDMTGLVQAEEKS